MDTIDTPTLWGYNMIYAMGGWIVFYPETFLKSSGVLYRYLYCVNNTARPTTRDEIAYLSGPTQGYDTLLVIGLGAAGVIGLVGVFLSTRRRG